MNSLYEYSLLGLATIILIFVAVCNKKQPASEEKTSPKAQSSGSSSSNPTIVNKNKTSEAVEGLKKIRKGAKSYFEMEHKSPKGERLPCRFPDSVEMTPKGSACEHKNKQFPGDMTKWEHQTWKNLIFGVSVDHYYSYKFERHHCKTMKLPPDFIPEGYSCMDSYLATAIGDLDCDGTYSTFETAGFGISTDGINNCKIIGPQGIRTTKATE